MLRGCASDGRTCRGTAEARPRPRARSATRIPTPARRVSPIAARPSSARQLELRLGPDAAGGALTVVPSSPPPCRRVGRGQRDVSSPPSSSAVSVVTVPSAAVARRGVGRRAGVAARTRSLAARAAGRGTDELEPLLDVLRRGRARGGRRARGEGSSSRRSCFVVELLVDGALRSTSCSSSTGSWSSRARGRLAWARGGWGSSVADGLFVGGGAVRRRAASAWCSAPSASAWRCSSASRWRRRRRRLLLALSQVS